MDINTTQIPPLQGTPPANLNEAASKTWVGQIAQAVYLNASSIAPTLKQTLSVTDLRQIISTAKCDGTTDDSDALIFADTQTGIGAIGIYAPTRLSANVTLTHPIYIGPQGTLSVDVGKTLTLSTAIADAASPFPGAGTVTDGSGTTKHKAASFQTTANVVLMRSNAAFQVGGLNGPYIFNDTALDTISFQAQPGALPSGDTTNLQLYPPAVGGKVFLNLTSMANGANEQRLLIGSNGASQNYLFSQFVAGTGVARDVVFSDGVSATEAWTLGASSGGNPPDLRLGFKVPITSATPSSGVQTLMNLDASMNLLIGGGANIGIIGFQKHLYSSGSAPSVSGGGSGASVAGTDTKGIISIGGGGAVTSCSLTFAAAYSSIPTIILIGQGTGSAVLSLSAASTTGFTLAASADIQSKGVHYHVIQ